MKRIVFFILIASPFGLNAQTEYLDSLRQRTDSKELSSLLVVDACTALANELIDLERPQEAKPFIDKAIAVSSLLNYKIGIINAINVLASYYQKTGEFEQAIVLFNKMIELSEKEGMTEGMRTGNNNLGLCYHDMGEYELSLRYHLKALELADNPTNISKSYSNISRTYYANNQLDKAIEYCEMALKMEQENNASPTTIIIRIINLSSYYNDYEMADKSIVLLQNAITFNDTTVKHNLYGAYLKANLGHAYFQIADYKNSIESIQQAYPIFESTQNERLVGQLDINLAHAYSKMGDEKNALFFMHSALSLTEKSTELEFKRYSFEVAAEVFKNSGDYKNALIYHEKLSDLKDSLLDAEKTRSIVEMQTKYESVEKEKKILLKEKELGISQSEQQKQQLIIWSVTFGLTLVLFLTIYIFYRLKQSNKQKKIIEIKSKENELLLGEIHHRVKNNLQVISSLLSLQAKSLTDDAAKKAILEGKERVKSMGLIHKMLYQNDNFSGVEMKEYIEKLLDSLLDSFGITKTDLKIELSFDTIKLDVDTAIPLGLIINELAINAMKYAFVKTQEPHLSIKLYLFEKKLELIFADNGSGKVTEIENSNSFGTSLIKSLVRQLNGEMIIEENKGLRYRIVLKDYKIV